MNLLRIAAVPLALLAACAQADTAGASFPPGETAFDAGNRLPSITNYLSAVRSGDGSLRGQLIRGNPPIARFTSPNLRVSASGFTIPGGAKIVSLDSGASAYARILIAVSGATDFYELTGIPPATASTLIFSVAQTAQQSFTLGLAVAPSPDDPDCPRCFIGPFSKLPVNLTSVGTGPVQVSLTWDQLSDLDLHVVQPNNTEISWVARSDPATGGTLDLDSNAGCAIDGKNNENVTWQSGTPLHGRYIVRVDNYKSCGQTPILYAVTVNRVGQEPLIFVSRFTDTGDLGGLGSGFEITRFDY